MDPTSLRQQLIQNSETEVSLEFTGLRTQVPQNLVSKLIYVYQCVHNTSIGPLILGAKISPSVEKSIKHRERFDFFMHFYGCPWIVFLTNFVMILYGHGISFLGAVIFFGVCCLLFLLHVINLAWTLFYFAVPVHQSRKLALFLWTHSNGEVNDSNNDFIKISASQRSTYVLTDSQALIFSQAGVRGEIQAMLYNNHFEVKYNRCYGYCEVFLPFPIFLVQICAMLVILIDGPVQDVGGVVGFTLTASLVYYFLYWLLILFLLCLSWGCCSCNGPLIAELLPQAHGHDCCRIWDWCTQDKRDVLDLISNGQAREAIRLTYIHSDYSWTPDILTNSLWSFVNN